MAVKPARKMAMKRKGLVKMAGVGTRTRRNKSERGTGLKFHAHLYDYISRFTGATRIKYVPNPKTKGSKSYVRYARYARSKTVAEALKYCKPADLLWDYERGYFTVVGGPISDTPACLRKDSKDPAVEILGKFRGPPGTSLKMDPAVRKKLSAYAKAYGLDLDKVHEEAGKQCNSEDSDVQTQRVIANAMAKRKLTAKKITDQDVVDVLRIWGFPENETRLNVLPPGVKSIHSDTLGVLRMRDGTYRIFDPTTRYSDVTRLLCRWFRETKGKQIPNEFGFTGININHNYAGRRHRDNGNEGPSAIKAIGKFTGGRLDYFPKDVKRAGRAIVTSLSPKDSVTMDIGKEFTLFNGNNAHGVQPFKGERFSLVFFSTARFWRVKGREVKALKKLGFQVPTQASMKRLKDISAKQDASRAR